MQTEERELRRGRGGTIIVVVLAVIFFVLLALVIRGVKSDDDASSSKPIAVYVIPQKLRVRAEASAKSALVGELKQGDRAMIVESQGSWAKIETKSGLNGWVDRNALEEQEERDRRTARVKSIRALPPLEGVALQSAALYSGPGLFYSVIGQLPPESKVKVFTRDHDFYAIDYSGDVAYIEVDSLDLSASSADTQLEVAATEPTSTEPQTASTETAAPLPTEPEPLPEAPPVTSEPEEPARNAGVYPVVPPGGTQPRVISRVVPNYPSSARARGIEGTVVLRAIVHRDGRVSDVEVLRDIGGAAGDAAAEAVRRWRFKPATVNGEPIDVYYSVTVNFRLSD